LPRDPAEAGRSLPV